MRSNLIWLARINILPWRRLGLLKIRKCLSLNVLSCLLVACATPASTPENSSPDLLPMYGGLNRSLHPELKNADEKLIQDSISEYGDRKNASAAFVNQGFSLYREHALDAAMRRFNQAWILDPENPEVYWGFGSVLHNRGKSCQAMEMLEKALSFNRYLTGLYPDAGRMIVLCTVSNARMSPEQKTRNFDKSERLFIQAAIKDRNKGYVHALWATAYYWQARYEEAWDRVHRSRQFGGQVPDRFVSLLRQKMPEPSVGQTDVMEF